MICKSGSIDPHISARALHCMASRASWISLGTGSSNYSFFALGYGTFVGFTDKHTSGEYLVCRLAVSCQVSVSTLCSLSRAVLSRVSMVCHVIFGFQVSPVCSYPCQNL